MMYKGTTGDTTSNSCVILDYSQSFNIAKVQKQKQSAYHMYLLYSVQIYVENGGGIEFHINR